MKILSAKKRNAFMTFLDIHQWRCEIIDDSGVKKTVNAWASVEDPSVSSLQWDINNRYGNWALDFTQVEVADEVYRSVENKIVTSTVNTNMVVDVNEMRNKFQQTQRIGRQNQQSFGIRVGK